MCTLFITYLWFFAGLRERLKEESEQAEEFSHIDSSKWYPRVAFGVPLIFDFALFSLMYFIFF